MRRLAFLVPALILVASTLSSSRLGVRAAPPPDRRKEQQIHFPSGPRHRPNSRAQQVVEVWTAESMDQAVPRDYTLLVDDEMEEEEEDGNPTSGGGGNGRNRHLLRKKQQARSLEDVAVSDDPWENGGHVQTAVGRIYYQMKNQDGITKNYLCSGTVVTDSVEGRSIILTAAHCTYDDLHKEFATNVLFIPNQEGTTGNRSNRNCFDDPLGCWVPEFGVVDQNWADQSWSENIQWDYAFYVVPDKDAQTGPVDVPQALDQAVETLLIDFSSYPLGEFGHAFGYPSNHDPDCE